MQQPNSPLPSSSRVPFSVQTLGGKGPNPADVGWLWHGLLAPGRLTLLTSLWKSGKTTMLAILLARMKNGGTLLGLPVCPAKALILSEENPTLWSMRCDHLALGDHIGVISMPFGGTKASQSDWKALIDHCAAELGPEGGRLLVIDTVATLMPVGVETNADCMVRALAPLRLIAQQGIAVWLMHHPHKAAAKAGQWSRGTGSLPASVDIVLEMQPCRPDDYTDRRRVLLGMSRHEETPRRLVIELNSAADDYRVLPETTDVDFDNAWSAIRRVLSKSDAPQSAAAILRRWPPHLAPPSRATLHRWLARAVERNLLRCEPGARANAPYQYWLPETKE
jgi:hypothetical protein